MVRPVVALGGLLMMVVTCDLIEPPEPLKILKTEVNRLSELEVNQENAFDILLQWQVVDSLKLQVTQFRIERISVDTTVWSPDTSFTAISLRFNSPESFDSLASIEGLSLSITLEAESDTVVTLAGGNTSGYSYRDTTAGFRKVNWYRVTALHNDLEAFPLVANRGIYLSLERPAGLGVTSLSNRYQLRVEWDASQFAHGYAINRAIDGVSDSVTITQGPSLIESSHSLPFSLQDGTISFDSALPVSGLQPNNPTEYQVWAFATRGEEVRHSDTASVTGELVIPGISFRETTSSRPISATTIRFYIESSVAVFDTLNIFARVGSGSWELRRTLFPSRDYATKMSYYPHSDSGIALVDDESAHADGQDYFLVGKGIINGWVSDTLSGVKPLPAELSGFTFVEGGSFDYGRPEALIIDNPVNPFYMSIYEATSNRPPEHHDTSIISPISWCEAVKYCDSLTLELSGIDENIYSFRLPNEYEWEYAAKWNPILRQSYDYPWESNITTYHANFQDSGDPYGNIPPYLTPVGYYDGTNDTFDNASFFGLYDMAGNVLEWCLDNSEDWNGARDSCGPSFAEPRPLRGGAYFHAVSGLTTLSRYEYAANLRIPGFGFRILMEKK